MAQIIDTAATATSPPAADNPEGSIEELAVGLMERARSEGVNLVGPGGLLQGLTKTVLESNQAGSVTTPLTRTVFLLP